MRQLWANHHDVDYPTYGVTSVLDAEVPSPDGIEATVAGLDTGALHRAALAVAELLAGIGAESDFGRYVSRRLRMATPDVRTALL